MSRSVILAVFTVAKVEITQLPNNKEWCSSNSNVHVNHPWFGSEGWVGPEADF